MSWQKLVQPLAILLIAAGLAGAADVTGPEKVDPQHTVKMGIVGLPEKAKPKWYVKPLDGQDPAEIEWVSDSRSKDIRWIGPVGRYEVTVKWAFVEKDGSVEFDEATRVVTIGKPAPPPPKPDDPMVKRFQSSYDKCADRDATTLSNYVALYKYAATALRNPVNQPQLRTYKQLYGVMKTVAENTKVSQKLLPLQQDVQAYMVGLGYPGPLSDEVVPDQAKLADDLDKIATALAGVK